MTTMNISLPDEMRAFIEEQLKSGGYSTASEYVRELIRNAQKAKAHARLEALLLEGLDSGEPVEVTPEFWKARHAELERRVQARAKSKKN
jgi:antitoxin ParD1/3/4